MSEGQEVFRRWVASAMINLLVPRELGYQVRNFIFARQKFVQWFLISIMAATVVSVLIWILGFPLFVNADENLVCDVRFLTCEDFPRPSFFFSLIYWVTNTCGPEFYSCVKVLNTALYSIQSFFIFLTARFFLNKTTSLFIALLFLIFPLYFYTAMFIQESLFGALFWTVTWLLIARKFKVRLVRSTRVYKALIAALFLAMFFTNVSAIFMLLPISFLFAISINHQGRPVGFLFFGFVAGSMISVLSVNSLIFEEITVFGESYEGELTKALEIISTNSSITIFTLFQNAFHIGVGHVIGLVILFSLPLATLISKAIPNLTSPSTLVDLSQEEFFEFFIFLSLIFMIGGFTAFSVIDSVVGDSILQFKRGTTIFSFRLFLFFHSLINPSPQKVFSLVIAIVILAVELFLKFEHHKAEIIYAPIALFNCEGNTNWFTAAGVCISNLYSHNVV